MIDGWIEKQVHIHRNRKIDRRIKNAINRSNIQRKKRQRKKIEKKKNRKKRPLYTFKKQNHAFNLCINSAHVSASSTNTFTVKRTKARPVYTRLIRPRCFAAVKISGEQKTVGRAW